MSSINVSKANNKENENAKPNPITEKIKSDFFLQKFFSLIPYIKSLEIIKYNINIQKRLNININNYKDFSERFSSIELEIIPIKYEYGPFIKIN